MKLDACKFCGGELKAEDVMDFDEWIGTEVSCSNCWFVFMFADIDEAIDKMNTNLLSK